MDLKPRHITVIKKYPAFRDSFVFGCWKWLEGKRKDDYAEGLWRIHNKLYDLTDFIVRHPGGQYWIEATVGTDITEAFESHHLTSRPRDFLKDFFVKDAVDPRNYFYTYNEDGFYQTLKKRVATKLKTIDTKNLVRNSKIIHDVNLFALFFAAVMMNRCEDNKWFLAWTLLAAQCFAWSANISHNFIHQADNWRMYTANISLVPCRDTRVSHVLSHHMYPNTYSDFEVTCFEPYYKWIPTQAKSWFYMIFAILITPVLYFTFFHNMWRYRVQGYIWATDNVFKWDDLLLLALPMVMITFGTQQVTYGYLGVVYIRWGYIVIISNFLYAIVHFNRGHHGTTLNHQNDEIKSFDFGEYQLSTTVDRREANFNLFTSLVYNGDQVLHHLFPTLDAAILPELREVLLRTCKEFDVDLHPEISMFKATVEQFKQLFRSETIKCS